MLGAESQIAFFDYEAVNFICYGSCVDGNGQNCMGTYSPVTTKNAFWAESKKCQITFDHAIWLHQFRIRIARNGKMLKYSNAKNLQNNN